MHIFIDFATFEGFCIEDGYDPLFTDRIYATQDNFVKTIVEAVEAVREVHATGEKKLGITGMRVEASQDEKDYVLRQIVSKAISNGLYGRFGQ